MGFGRMGSYEAGMGKQEAVGKTGDGGNFAQRMQAAKQHKAAGTAAPAEGTGFKRALAVRKGMNR